jgi:hypothetical protein
MAADVDSRNPLDSVIAGSMHVHSYPIFQTL